MNLPPEPNDGKLVRETDDRPVVRDDEHNPVVRARDLENAIAPLEIKLKVGFAVVGAIGVANLLGIKTIGSGVPETVAQALTRFFT